MNYLRADSIFPDELLSEIQKYVQDGLIYIPKPKSRYKKWGENTDSRNITMKRNEDIKNKFRTMHSIGQLADEYCLSIETIKKIVYKK